MWWNRTKLPFKKVQSSPGRFMLCNRAIKCGSAVKTKRKQFNESIQITEVNDHNDVHLENYVMIGQRELKIRC